jgi:signal transduction histidine kinase
MLSYYAISALVNCLSSVFACLIVVVKNPKSRLNRAFVYLALSIGLWSFFYFLSLIANSAKDAFMFAKFLNFFGTFTPVTFFHFSVCLVNQWEKRRITIFISYSISLIIAILMFTPLMITGVSHRPGFLYWSDPGSLYICFVGIYCYFVIYGNYLIWRYYRVCNLAEKNRIKYVFWGTTLGFIAGTTNIPFWYKINIPPVLNIFVTGYVVLFGYSAVKHNLMDIKITITRATIFIFLYAAILGIPFLIGYYSKSWIATGGSMLIFATVGPFIYTNLRLAIERRFFYQEKIKLIQEEQLRRQKTIDTFSGSMAHEIANPIHVIVGLIDMVKIKTLQDLKDNIPAKDRAYLEERFKTISEGAFRIAGMVKTIREFSAQSTGSFKPVILKEVINNVLTMLSGKLKEETINLEVSLIDDITVIGNKIALEEAILNILLNSIEAFANCETSDKAIIIAASLQPDNKALVTISDNACGIPKNMLNDIFLDFVTTKPSSSNLGMGLSLCRKIVALHKGKIWAESKGEDKGAAIFVELPLV